MVGYVRPCKHGGPRSQTTVECVASAERIGSASAKRLTADWWPVVSTNPGVAIVEGRGEPEFGRLWMKADSSSLVGRGPALNTALTEPGRFRSTRG